MFFCLFLPQQSVTCRKREVRGINIVHSPVCEGVEELASLVAGVQPSKFKFSLSWLDLFQQIFHWIRAGHVLAARLVLVATTISPLRERDWGLNIDLGPGQPASAHLLQSTSPLLSSPLLSPPLPGCVVGRNCDRKGQGERMRNLGDLEEMVRRWQILFPRCQTEWQSEPTVESCVRCTPTSPLLHSRPPNCWLLVVKQSILKYYWQSCLDTLTHPPNCWLYNFILVAKPTTPHLVIF